MDSTLRNFKFEDPQSLPIPIPKIRWSYLLCVIIAFLPNPNLISTIHHQVKVKVHSPHSNLWYGTTNWRSSRCTWFPKKTYGDFSSWLGLLTSSHLHFDPRCYLLIVTVLIVLAHGILDDTSHFPHHLGWSRTVHDERSMIIQVMKTHCFVHPICMFNLD